MQIFCDESGGVDPANDVFLVAAVALPPNTATRLLKSFRKAARWRDTEVKGHFLTPEQRRVFFNLLQQIDMGSIVVSCSRGDGIGGWAMGALSERTIYTHLLREACLGLIGSVSDPLTITPDGGRYKKTDLNRIAGELTGSVRDLAASVPRVTVGFADSSSLPGLQIADVIANSVFQVVRDVEISNIAAPLLTPLTRSGRLTLRAVELASLRPPWLSEGQKAEKPP